MPRDKSVVELKQVLGTCIWRCVGSAGHGMAAVAGGVKLDHLQPPPKQEEIIIITEPMPAN